MRISEPCAALVPIVTILLQVSLFVFLSNSYNSASVATLSVMVTGITEGCWRLLAGQHLNQDTVMMQLDMAVMNAFKMLHIYLKF